MEEAGEDRSGTGSVRNGKAMGWIRPENGAGLVVLVSTKTKLPSWSQPRFQASSLFSPSPPVNEVAIQGVRMTITRELEMKELSI